MENFEIKEAEMKCLAACRHGWRKILDKSLRSVVMCDYTGEQRIVKEMINEGLSCPKRYEKTK